MFLVIGNYLAKTKQNYSAGIRLPWTLSSEENWNRTHRVSSRLFIFCGLAMIANGFLDSKILLFFIMAVLIVIPYAYSFFLFKKGIWCTLLEHAFVAAIRAYYSRGRCHINCNPAAFYINKSLGILTSLFRFWYNNTVCIVLKEPFQTEEI